jgi:hypothetical protein
MMNERIKELAEQAGITTNLDTDFFEKDPNKWVDYYSEKFAELIIQECAALARNHLLNEADRSYMIHKKIKEHFGVE